MELQEKVDVPVFTGVDNDLFLRDIYPKVRKIRVAVILDVCGER